MSTESPAPALSEEQSDTEHGKSHPLLTRRLILGGGAALIGVVLGLVICSIAERPVEGEGIGLQSALQHERDGAAEWSAGGREKCRIFEDRSSGIIFTNYQAAMQAPRLYCACLSDAARSTSSHWLMVAIPVGLLGALLALLGGALGPPEGAKPGTLRGERGILLVGVGALLVSVAVYANSRATAASTAAAEAHSALTLPTEKMFAGCVGVKSAWMSSRVESAALLLSRLGKEGAPEEDVSEQNGGPKPKPRPKPEPADTTPHTPPEPPKSHTE